ncbi:MAG: diguanylate cyclase domain protein [Micavibrio sp.]|nr:diguanylate cyclase domain protein [Micavibrio sp.]
MTAQFWINHLAQTLSDNGMVAYVWDVQTDVFEWQGDMHALLGLEPADYPKNGSDLKHLMNPQDVLTRMTALHASLTPSLTAEPANFSITYRLRRKNGLQVDVVETATIETDRATGAQKLRGVIRVASAEQLAGSSGKPGFVEKLGNGFAFASYDTSMTHYGRLMIHQKIKAWGDQARTGDGDNIGYLLVAGIDRLSMFNEAFGAQFTDEIIEKTGKRLRQMIGADGTVTRIGGDVFAMFLSSAPHAEMAALARHMLHAVQNEPLSTSQGPIGVGLSIGGVLVRPDCKDPADMIAKAEMALQTAKSRGRGRFISYNEAAGDGQSARMQMRSADDFMAALKDNRVRLAFQPVVDAQTHAVEFHECLLRYVDGAGKIHAAGSFIPAIEKLGLSRLVDRHALRLSLQELEMFPDVSLSVNVSNLSLNDPDWLRGIVVALRDRTDVAKRMIVEITESAVIHDMDKTLRVIRTLRDLGCGVAIDDFGSGYTGFSQLKEMAVDIVKIDKTFVRNMAEKENHLFVKTLQMLADGLGIRTVGEGAETMTEAKLLASDGINLIQGYAFGYPGIDRCWLPKDHKMRKVIVSSVEGVSKAIA